jgi:glutaredoxin
LLSFVLLILCISGLSTWWASRQDARLGEAVSALVGPGDLRMLSSETCGICTAARLWFHQHGVPFEECFIERDTQCRTQFEALRASGTPVVLVRGVPEQGFSPRRLHTRLGGD